MQTIVDIFLGFGVLADLKIITFLIGGFLIGTFFGAMPGLTSVLAIALLLPFTYSIDVVPALVMCASIFMAGMYSGSITATTINIPGAPSSMMTALEGNALMKQGFGANALGHAALGSIIGGVIGTLMLIFLMPIASDLALWVRTPGKFSLIFFALAVIIFIDTGSTEKSLAAALFGIMLATIGIDVLEPVARINFGTEILTQGIDLMPLIIGAFALSEILVQAENWNVKATRIDPNDPVALIRRRDFIPKMSEIRQIGLWTYLRSALIGYSTGVLPGAGGSMAAFVSYAEANRRSSQPETFGKGSREGIAAAETANNAMCGGAFVPMMMFGIPGDATTAVVLGVLIINGLQPGPQLLDNQMDLIAPMFGSLLISALILIPLTLFLMGPYFIRIVRIPQGLLYSGIAVVALVGSYVATFSVFQMTLAVVFGVICYLLRREGYSIVPLLLGFILGPDLEQYFRRSLSLEDGNPIVFITNPDSLVFLLLTAAFVFAIRRRKRSSEA